MQGVSETHQKFAEWLAATGMAQHAVGALLGCDPSMVSRLKKGKQWPSRAVANAIERESRGLIKSTDWDEAQRAARAARRAQRAA